MEDVSLSVSMPDGASSCDPRDRDTLRRCKFVLSDGKGRRLNPTATVRSSRRSSEFDSQSPFQIRQGWAMLKAWAHEVATTYTRSQGWMMAMTVVTLSSCLFYIVGTYLGDYAWVLRVEITFGCFFVVDYLLSLIAAPVPLFYALSWGGMIDLVSCLQVFGEFQIWMAALSFVRYLRLGKAIRVMRNHRLLQRLLNSDDVTVKATLLVVRVLGLVLMTTAILYGTELASRMDNFNEPDWKWHDALYFTVVTLTTVGYGDILPVRTTTRLLMVAVIVFAFTYVPLQVSRLVDAIGSRPKFRNGFAKPLVGNQIHLLLVMAGLEDPGEGFGGRWDGGGGGSEGVGGQAGKGEGFSRDFLERCIDEVFHEDHGLEKGFFWIVVMAPFSPTPEIENLICLPKYMSRVRYFCGSVTDPGDMAAVCAEYADCIFLFPSSRPVGGNARAAEEGVTLAAKALRRYLDRTPVDETLMSKVVELSETGRPRRTVVTVGELRSKDQLLGFGIDHVICYDEIKMAMLACSTRCPSFLPFMVKCVHSGADDGSPPTRNGARRHDAGGASRHPATNKRHGQSSSATELESGSRAASGPGGPHASKEELLNRKEADGKGWLRDYMSGASFTLYSISLSDVPPESSVWSMSFRRAALATYDYSDGKVLLLAAVRDMNDGMRSRGPYRRQWGARGSRLVGAHIDVEIFPQDAFNFTSDSHVLVLAQSKRKAEEVIFFLQHDAYSGDLEAPSLMGMSLPQSPPNDGTFVKPGRDSAGLVGGMSAVSPVMGADSAFPFKPASCPSSNAVAGVDLAVTATSVLAVTTSEFSTTVGSNFEVPIPEMSAEVTEENLEASERSTVSPMRNSTSPPSTERPQLNTAESRRRIRSRSASSMYGSPIGTLPRLRSTGSRRGSRVNLRLDEETKTQLEKCWAESRHEDGVDWKQAFEALKRAKAQLQELDTEATFEGDDDDVERMNRISVDTVGFFKKVEAVAESVADALRVHTSAVPMDLEGHIVLVGGYTHLHHFILALRRQRPLQPIVVVTENESTFFDLQERLVECKYDEPGLNIYKIYHVFGLLHDRSTLESARFAQADAVVLASDQPTDSFVLLEAFELEQFMAEIPPGRHRPQIFIDLSKDSSIYYCDLVLGGAIPNMGFGPGGEEMLETSDPSHIGAQDVRNWPLFAAGNVYTESVMDIFAVQLYFGVHILAFVEALLQIQPPPLVEEDLFPGFEEPQVPVRQVTRSSQSVRGITRISSMTRMPSPTVQSRHHNTSGVPGTGGDERNHRVDSGNRGAPPPENHEDIHPNYSRGQYAHLRVSASFRGKTYGDLARYIIERGAMPLGLYRPAGIKGSSLPYAHFNPSPDEALHPWPSASQAVDGMNTSGRTGVSNDSGRKSERFASRRRWPRFDAREDMSDPSSRSSSAEALRGDDVFVLLSKDCPFSTEV